MKIRIKEFCKYYKFYFFCDTCDEYFNEKSNIRLYKCTRTIKTEDLEKLVNYCYHPTKTGDVTEKIIEYVINKRLMN